MKFLLLCLLPLLISSTHHHSKKYLSKKDDSSSNSTLPVFLGGLTPLSENQKSPTFMPIDKDEPTSRAPNGQNFEDLNYTKVHKLKVKGKVDKEEELPTGYYGESRITYNNF